LMDNTWIRLTTKFFSIIVIMMDVLEDGQCLVPRNRGGLQGVTQAFSEQ